MPDLPLTESAQGVEIIDELSGNIAEVTEHLSKKGLNVYVINPEQPQYRPIVDDDSTDVALTGTFQTIFNVTSTEGKLDYIRLLFNNKNVEVRLTIDGNVAYTLSLADLNDDHGIDAKTAYVLPIFVESSGKEFHDIYTTPCDFTDSILIEARELTGNRSLLSRLIRYRVKV